MTEKRIQFNSIVQNQLPAYVREEFPLISEFLKQYYLSQEFKGAPADLIQNIDQYIRLNETTNLVDSVVLLSDVSIVDTTILVESETGTSGFPDSYGLIQIDDEIIVYTSKTFSSFLGCIRGFSGVSSYQNENNPDQLIFEETNIQEHLTGATVKNLSNLFLKEFLLKTKYQLLPGLEDRELTPELNQNIFIKQSRDFYSNKGTDRSFQILFKALYNENVQVVRPRDFLFKPSDAHYTITNDLVVESISGDPLDLENTTLIQDSYSDIIQKAYAPVTSVEKIISGVGQTFYRISIDAGYNRDINVDGSTYGNFSVHPKTRLIGDASYGTTVLDVDSTIGFPNEGELTFSYNDGSIGIVSYTSKSSTQFYGCSNIVGSIGDASIIALNTYATNYDGTIRIRINSVLDKLDLRDNTWYFSDRDSAKIKTLGIKSQDFVSKNWFYNVSSKHEVESIYLIDSSDKTYRLVLKTPHYFSIGDSLIVTDNNNESQDSNVIDIISNYSIVIKGQNNLPLDNTYIVKRKILRSNSSVFPDSSIYSTNVQNIYKDSEKTLVASSSIPSYYFQPLDATDRSITFSGTFSGDEFVISTTDHGFYTGDGIYYTPEQFQTISTEDGITTTNTTIISSLFDEGFYFIKRVSATTVKFAKSRADIYNSTFITLSETKTVSNNKIELYKFKSKTLKTQKLLREISDPIDDGTVYETNPGFNGILINGVEILNYKSYDIVYYGKITGVDVLSPGSEYDVINPPLLTISDKVGVGATGYVSVKGSLSEIKILDPGFDYIDTPAVNISGGNGSGAVASVNMKLIDHAASFNSDSASNQIGIGSTVSTIGFSTYHKFRNGEKVIYDPKSQTSVGGITTNSTYFVSVKTPYVIKLHKTLEDSISGINTVTLTSYGVGEHYLRSYNKKSVIQSINVISPGSNYENKKRTTNSSGISTSLNQITIQNHDYNSGEIVKYTSEGSAIGGLTSGSEYYVTRIDDDNFRLSNVGLGITDKDFFYKTNQYISFTNSGVGTHVFNYPDITVSLVGKIGISSVGSETFEASVLPIFRGEITSVHLSNSGVGYGSSDIINFKQEPQISLVSGQDAQLQPVISNGRISEVIVLNSGKQYISPPNLIINGEGNGAVITPVIENGLLKSVKVIEPGFGYSPNSTSIIVISPGNNAKFKGNVQTWRINLFERYFNQFAQDDGFIENGINGNYDLQYCHIYAPRKLRESIFSLDQTGKILYGKKDLRKINDIETQSTDHSPIIGWAYDGHPIYGPYGYSKSSGGVVSQMKSGYKLDLKQNRPSVNNFPPGFFVEDYTFYKLSDESVLDENNGRFCITPEYPKGTYAYFATINDASSDSSGPFNKYKRPVFPYLIGHNFKSIPNKFNYDALSNQDNYDLNSTSWIRNTDPYNLFSGFIQYDYLTIPNTLSKIIDIKSVYPGVVEDLGIGTGGSNYRVNDEIIFDNSGTRGFGASAKVSKLLGKTVNTISIASSSISNVEIYPLDNKGSYVAFSTVPHNFSENDLVSITGLNTTSFKPDGSYKVGITTNTLILSGFGTNSIGVGTIGATGIVTYINVVGDLNYPSIRENDIFQIDSERIKVLNIDPKLSRIRVLRQIDGTVGSSHSVGTKLNERSRKLTFNLGFSTTYINKVNREIYFDPKESIGLGITAGVGIGSTIFFSNPGTGISEIFIPTKSIYIKNHNLETGDQLIYSPNGGRGLQVLVQGSVGVTTLSDQQIVYVAKISNDLIGISTVKVGVGTTGTFVGIASTHKNSTTLFFSGIGTGTYHSFKTNYDAIKGKIVKNTVIVSTAQTHGLVDGDYVYINVNPSISTTFTFKYNDYTRKVLVNPKTFTASGINTSSNSITINNHGFETGDKVVHTSIGLQQGLQNNKIYYVVKVDSNTFKLSDNYFSSVSSIPSVVGLATTTGEISLVNPPIEVYRNSTVSFDLSHPSLSYTKQSTLYSAFQLNFYLDENFTQKYDKNADSRSFEVQRVGAVGISTNAKVILYVNESTPSNLYYKLDPLFENDIPVEKQEINIDSTVFSNNKIIAKQSLYNGKYKVSVASTSSFTYPLGLEPERSSYISSTSSISYQTDSLYAYGSISELKLTNKGKNYYSLPGISTILSTFGSGSIINISSNSIGSIKNTKLKDIGFDFSCDKTVRPSVSLPQVLKIDPLASFAFVGVSSFGRGYLSSPRLLVFDGKTGQLVPDVDLRYELNNPEVRILKNTFGISNVTPRILPVQNSNGVGIGSITFNSVTKDVTVTLAVGFSTADTFPFKVNDRVLIENISVGVGSTSKGYNSEYYDYNLFTLKSVDENIGGVGSVTYNLSAFLKPGESPGSFDAIRSTGRIIAEKTFPVFYSTLKVQDYIEGETVVSNSSTGEVESWDAKNQILKVISDQDFVINETIKGLSSNTQGIASSVTSFNSFISVNTSSKVEKGWEDRSGFLNDNLQRIQDSYYYQNFSYALKSKVDYDTWSDSVATLAHTLGFKKFSDYQLESYLPQEVSNSMIVGVSTDLTSLEIVNNITESVDLNCVYDFDVIGGSSSQDVSDEVSFSNKILTDYFESIGNRVLLIDDISGSFNSNPRSTRFSEVYRFLLDDARCQKYFIFINDRRYSLQKQALIITLLHDNDSVYLNQYGRLESYYDLGSFDAAIDGTEGILLFYPTNYSINDYNVTTLSYNLKGTLTGIGTSVFGNVAQVRTSSVSALSGPTTIVGIASTFSSAKVLVEITGSNGSYQFEEISVVHDGTEVQFLNYGQLTNDSYNQFSGPGLGTYNSYLSGSQLKIDFTPNVGLAVTVNTIQVAMANTSVSGVGTFDMSHARLVGISKTIASSPTPTANTITILPSDYNAAYLVAQVTDTTNKRVQMSEIMIMDDGSEVYISEFGNIETSSGLGTFGATKTGDDVNVTFTPLASINVDVRLFVNNLRFEQQPKGIIDFNNASVQTNYGTYYGTDTDIKRSFELTSKNVTIFERSFDGSDPSIVNVSDNTINIPNHFYVTGEKVTYNHAGAGSTQAIGITTTTFVSVGATDKVPTDVYIVKVNDDKIRLASSAANALKAIPQTLDITSVGIGTSHRFDATNQNARVLVSIDNIIQSPLVSTGITSRLSRQALISDDLIYFVGINSFFGGDLIRIDNEIMKIEGIGIGSTNAIRVRRPWLGTPIADHTSGTLITKVVGSYNIVDNTLNFVDPPYGNTPFGTSTNAPDERDWTGVSTGSNFQGRVFLRSGIPNSINDSYYKNYIFDDISDRFDGNRQSFTLKANSSDVVGITSENAVILINDVFQGPGLSYDYTLSEAAGITTISFTGAGTSLASDVNTSSRPSGGIIVSVGSSSGFGYQPLVSAGGTVNVSMQGQAWNISIGNTGSGYRAADKYEILTNVSSTIGIGSTTIYIDNENSVIEILNLLKSGSNCTIGIGSFIENAIIDSIGATYVNITSGSTSAYSIPSGTQVSVKISNPQFGIVNVGIATSSVGISTVTHIGFATVFRGNIVSPVTVTKVAYGYTCSNPPRALFDAPLSYSNLPLIYSSSSTPGAGQNATIDIVVGQGSSVIDFEINNTGYGYKNNEILTVAIGGATGIPTTSAYKEFQISVQNVFTDKFTGWTIGTLEVFDNIEKYFDSERTTFPLMVGGNLVSIRSSKGSKINVQDILLVFINDILQVPGRGYVFKGGSNLTFTEAPKPGDKAKIIFYKGSGDTDVVFRNIIETVKVGDELKVGYDSYGAQYSYSSDSQRTVTSVNSTDVVQTDPYFGPDSSGGGSTLVPILWCRQTEDKIVNEKEVSKSRDLYEPVINPYAYIISSVGIGSTVIYVDNIKPFFNMQNENDISLLFQNKIKFISQDIKVSASATAVVSSAGTISSVIISDGGVGYSTATVSFASTVGVGTTSRALGSVIIGAGGSVTGIAITNPGAGYATTNPPKVLISPPSVVDEENDASTYIGDSGIIVGFGTTSISAQTQLIFDLYIPKDSYLRDSRYVGTAITVSSLGQYDYFVVQNSNVGIATTSLTSIDKSNNIIGIGTQFVDNVYEVNSSQIITTNVTGVGVTYVTRVFVKISNGFKYGVGILTSNYFGSYSWGKILLETRTGVNSFRSYTLNGTTGITTSMIVQRVSPLKYKNYIV